MRIVKIVAWLVCIFVVQTVFGRVIGIYGIVPDLLLAFPIIFSMWERDLFVGAVVLLICAVTDASGTGRLFPAVVLIITAAGLISRGANDRMRYIPRFVKGLFITAAAAFVLGAAEYFSKYLTIGTESVLKGILPYMGYTVIGFCIMYPIMRRTLFHKKDEKIMII